VLVLETIAKIRRMYHREGLGIKTIAKALKISKNTVKKFIRDDQLETRYQRETTPHRALAPYIEPLKARLLEDEKSIKKYKRTARKLFLELQAEGYSGSYDAVHHFIAGYKQEAGVVSLKHSFIPLVFEPGEAFQFDWSTESVLLKGELTTLKVAHIRLCYSRFFLVVAYPNEELEMVMDAHTQGFEFLGGQPQKGIYDNMKTAIQKILLGKARLFNPRFLALCAHYCFEPIACSVAAGWEKGQVENQVGTSRENFFSPLKRAEDLEALNRALRKDCVAFAQATAHPEQKDKTVWDVYQEEKPYLMPFQGAFEAYKVATGIVSSTSLVSYATNFYSVQQGYVHKKVTLRVYAHVIHVFWKDEKIGEHARCFGRHQKIYNPWHYVPLLARKPGALRNGAPFKALVLPEAFNLIQKKLSAYKDGDKQFIQILVAASEHGLEPVEKSITKTLSQGGCSVELVLHYLQAPSLSTPTTDFDCYNQAYLSQSFKEETHHV
jgi:transposase